jgi:cytochrome b561
MLPRPAAFAFLLKFHATTASMLMIGVLLHVGAVLIRLPIPKDGTFEKMMVPARGKSAEERL